MALYFVSSADCSVTVQLALDWAAVTAPADFECRLSFADRLACCHQSVALRKTEADN